MSEHVLENRRYWDGMAADWVAAGERAWQRTEPTWGIWGLPEAELQLLPADMAGMRAVELGCGTGYVSAWMTRRGARVIGLDNSSAQLATARRLAAQHGLSIHWVHANAEAPPLADGCVDFAISEYGAAIWCDPAVWLPAARRLLVPGGRLVFLGCHPLLGVCTPESGDNVDARLHRPYFGLHALDWRDVPIDPGGVEFNRTFSDWLALFRDTGFEVLDYKELAAPDDASGTAFTVSADWARQWPSEQVWLLRRAG